MTLALAIIAKDEREQLERIVRDYGRYFDEVVVAYDDDKCVFPYRDVYIKWVKYEKDEWEKNRGRISFARKRNFLADNIKSDYYFRLDTDDAIVNPHNIRTAFDKMVGEKAAILYSTYLYSKDEFGHCNAQHWRETIIKRCENLRWNKHIHENIIPKTTIGHKIAFSELFYIDHLVDPEHAVKSANRNIKYLVDEYKEDKENTDPRTLAYIGRMLASTSRLKEAQFFLEKHIASSGWDEDRYMSWCTIAEILRKQKEYQNAISAAFEAIAEKPNYPDAYIALHDIYFEISQWDKAIYWGNMAARLEVPKTFGMIDPSKYTWRLTLSLAFAYFQTNEYETAKRLFDKAKQMVPSLDVVKGSEKLFETAVVQDRFVKHIAWLVNYVKDRDETLVRKLVEAVPNDMDENDFIIKLKNEFLPQREHGKDEITLFCGQTEEAWSPKSVVKGIGGSEEAAINMSKELAKLGWKVTVYNTCNDDEGVYDGVVYKNWYKFNKNEKHNIVVSWRMNIFASVGVNARKKIIWLHDLPVNIVWDEHTVKTFDKVMVLSEYHKSKLPSVVPQEKIFVTSNGINADDFLERVENRKENRIIYASSYNRGLEKILDMWADIKKEVPDATLHVYYGWQVYDEFVRHGYIKDNGWKAQMVAKLAQDGVVEHGRIGHKELVGEYLKSAVFAYPCTYAGEINCIALTKAYACNCNIVTNDFAVMKERSDNAVKDENFKDALVEALQRPIQHGQVDEEYISENSWAFLAKDWTKRLFDENTVA